MYRQYRSQDRSTAILHGSIQGHKARSFDGPGGLFTQWFTVENAPMYLINPKGRDCRGGGIDVTSHHHDNIPRQHKHY